MCQGTLRACRSCRQSLRHHMPAYIIAKSVKLLLACSRTCQGTRPSRHGRGPGLRARKACAKGVVVWGMLGWCSLPRSLCHKLKLMLCTDRTSSRSTASTTCSSSSSHAVHRSCLLTCSSRPSPCLASPCPCSCLACCLCPALVSHCVTRLEADHVCLTKD